MVWVTFSGLSLSGPQRLQGSDLQVRDFIRLLIIAATIGIVFYIWVYATPFAGMSFGTLSPYLFTSGGYKAAIERQAIQTFQAMIFGGFLFWLFSNKDK